MNQHLRLCSIGIFCLALLLTASAVAQPTVVKQIPTNSHHFTSLNGKLYFASSDTLFTSNGTGAGTTMIAKTNEQIYSIVTITPDSRVFFITEANSQHHLWVTNGTSTSKMASFVQVIPLVVYKGEMYLRLNDGAHGFELWKVSGNTLSMVKDFNPGTGHGVFQAVISNDILYVSATTDGQSWDLWKTNGTAAGTTLASDMPFIDSFYGLTDVDGTIFFIRDSTAESNYEGYAWLWTTKGTTASNAIIHAFEPDFYNNYYFFTSMGGKLYFIRDFSVPDHYLWVSDGTPAGTYAVKRVERDGDVRALRKLKNQLVFYTQSQGFPGSMQRSDGTTEGTVPFYDLNNHADYSGLNVADLTVSQDYAFFVDYTVPAQEYPVEGDDFKQIFQSDLTSSGTISLKEKFGISFAFSDNIVAAGGNKIYFTTQSGSNSKTLWFYDADVVQACAGSGGILRELWTNVEGSTVAYIPTGREPNSKQTVSTFQGPTNSGDRYGARYRGFVCITEAGNYRFAIASNDNSELWLSTDTNPVNKRRIAYVNGYTNVAQYNKYTSQQSVAITLQPGQYYIEALHKEGVGSDHLSVRMTLPNGAVESPIQGSRLVPFGNANLTPTVSITSPTGSPEFSAPANVLISADASDPDGSIVKVEFYGRHTSSSMVKLGEDTSAPYTYNWNNLQQTGQYQVEARATDNGGATTVSAVANFTVKSGCSASGSILREVWTNVQGNMVSSIPLSRAADQVSYINIFEAPSNIGDQYATRIRGYVCAPWAGQYQFFIASNDHSELWISTDGNPANKVRIAFVSGATNPREWTKTQSQQSLPVNLQANQRVYIEALHKEGVGSDHIAVGWMMPGGIFERPIPGNRLSPFEISGSTMAVADGGETEMSIANVWPNPVSSGPLTFSLDSNLPEKTMVRLSVINAMGESVHQASFECEGTCDTDILAQTEATLRPGIYIVKGTANGKEFTKRLLVE